MATPVPGPWDHEDFQAVVEDLADDGDLSVRCGKGGRRLRQGRRTWTMLATSMITNSDTMRSFCISPTSFIGYRI